LERLKQRCLADDHIPAGEFRSAVGEIIAEAARVLDLIEIDARGRIAAFLRKGREHELSYNHWATPPCQLHVPRRL
jgi:hypothetical protein